MTPMNWQALASDPNWVAFWKSEEMQAWRENLVQKLVRGKWDHEAIGFIKGQIAAFDALQTKVNALAIKQERDSQLEFERQHEREAEAAPRRLRFPRIA